MFVRLTEPGCTLPETSAVTGHDLDATTAIFEVHMPRTLPIATAAIDKFDAHRMRTSLEAGGLEAAR